MFYIYFISVHAYFISTNTFFFNRQTVMAKNAIPFYACFGNIIIFIPFSGTEMTHLGLNETSRINVCKLPVKLFLQKQLPSISAVCSCILFACRFDQSWAHIKQTLENCSLCIRTASTLVCIWAFCRFLSFLRNTRCWSKFLLTPAVLRCTGTTGCISYRDVMKWMEMV